MYVLLDSEAISFNHYFLITYSECACVCVALVVHCEKPIVICDLSGCTIFSHIS